MTAQDILYKTASKYIGVHELDGPASNPQIKKWIKDAAEWLDPDDSKTAWCGCFRAALGYETGTGVVSAPYRAVNWINWGRSIIKRDRNIWPQGSTVIMGRPGGYHVALLDRITGDYMWLLGGNQSDSVNISRFPISKIIDIRIQ